MGDVTYDRRSALIDPLSEISVLVLAELDPSAFPYLAGPPHPIATAFVSRAGVAARYRHPVFRWGHYEVRGRARVRMPDIAISLPAEYGLEN